MSEQENQRIVEKMKSRNKGILYFLIDLTKTTQREFFKQEFPSCEYDEDVVVINDIEYTIDRIVINGQDFVIKGHEIVQCTPSKVPVLQNKAVTPDQMISDVGKKTLELLDRFNKKLFEEDKDEQYYHLVIDGEYPRPVLDEVEKIFKACAWAKVVCKTSSETGERPGLTGLQLWRQ